MISITPRNMVKHVLVLSDKATPLLQPANYITEEYYITLSRAYEYLKTFAIFSVMAFVEYWILQIDYHQEPKALGKVCKLLSDPRAFLFLGGCACFGMCTGFIWQFLFWWLEDLGGADGRHWIKLLQGLAMGIQCFGGEVPSLFLSGNIHRGIVFTLELLGFVTSKFTFLLPPYLQCTR